MSTGRPAGGPLVHHELCFGCGRQNVFGLLCELAPAADGRVIGRCFIKQDHQGPVQGSAHPGVLAAALIEALAFAGADLAEVELGFERAAEVGTFVELEATPEQASARSAGRLLAAARARRG